MPALARSAPSPSGTATRVICCSAGILFGGVFASHAKLAATLGLAALATFSLIGLAQLVVAVRRQLISLPSSRCCLRLADQPGDDAG
jgi:hypothetical protein